MITINITKKTCFKLKLIPQFVKHASYSSTGNWTFEEIRIPVPWGHLAGKWWGPHNKRPILGIHGWQDNCGSFDTLIPYLNPDVGFLTVDLPGHGLSSQIPPGAFYHWPDYVIVVKRIVDYFKWPKVSLMGHSLGGITCYLYTILYPDTVDFLICFEALKPLIFNTKKIGIMGKQIDSLIKYDNLNSSNDEPPSYSLQELEIKLHEGSEKSISLEACRHILQRGLVPSTKEPDKYYYKRDTRLKLLPILEISQKAVIENAHRLTCPTILCLCSHRASIYKGLRKAEDVYDIIKKTNKNFEIHQVDGSHHVHLNNPERLEGFVKTFINKYDVGDRSVGGLKQEIIFNNNKI